MKSLKIRHLRTVERKLREGDDLVYDDEKGIINDETGEVIVDIKLINGGGDFLNEEEEEKELEDECINKNKDENKIDLNSKVNLKKKKEEVEESFDEEYDEDLFDEDEIPTK